MAMSIFRLGLCLAICLAIGILGGVSTRPAIQTWYATLAKPPGTPPNWVFPLVWTTLYVMLALAWWLLWDRTPERQRGSAIAWFAAQLALNAIWSPLFFGNQAIGAALVVITLMVAATVATVVSAWRANKLAAILLMPYLAWISYATYLNGGIWFLNR